MAGRTELLQLTPAKAEELKNTIAILENDKEQAEDFIAELQEVVALEDRNDQLEQRNAQLDEQNAQLRESNERLKEDGETLVAERLETGLIINVSCANIDYCAENSPIDSIHRMALGTSYRATRTHRPRCRMPRQQFKLWNPREPQFNVQAGQKGAFAGAVRDSSFWPKCGTIVGRRIRHVRRPFPT